MRHTKIIATIGPASAAPEVLEALVAAGMDVARLNFSHGTHREHKALIRRIRNAARRQGRTVAILQDLAGPKIRIGPVPEPGIILEPGRSFILTAHPEAHQEGSVSVTYPELAREVKKGDRLMLADGLMEVVVEATDGMDITCTVITGGLLTSHKGINLPSGTIRAPAFTEKDRVDLLFGLEAGVDYVALSFVKSAEEIRGVRELIAERGRQTPIIAKIERHEALKVIGPIVAETDAIMVARGDLGVEIPLEEVPMVQKRLIHLANTAGKPVITATQMLRSMVDSPRPTRAEATDVVNAILDGADAVMLSEETAAGRYPVAAVQFMNRLALMAEGNFPHDSFLKKTPRQDIPDSVAHASCILADHLDARAIIAHTQSGLTALNISRFRPRQPIVALTPNKETLRRLALVWGCLPLRIRAARGTDDLIELAARAALDSGAVTPGDLVVMTVGHPVTGAGTTNMLRVKRL
ncbi:MAG: pyruvate kinase [Syntrophales bacterium]